MLLTLRSSSVIIIVNQALLTLCIKPPVSYCCHIVNQALLTLNLQCHIAVIIIVKQAIYRIPGNKSSSPLHQKTLVVAGGSHRKLSTGFLRMAS